MHLPALFANLISYLNRNMAQSWGWPYIWVEWTKWAVWANLDYFSTTKNGSIGGSSQSVIDKFGEMDNYIEYAFIFMIIPVIIVILFLLSRLVTRKYGVRYDKYEPRIEFWVLLLLQLLYMPVCLALSRLYYCENGVASVDPSNDCLAGQHLIIVVLGLVFALPLYIGLPIYLYRRIRGVVIFDLSTDHEKRLQAWELEEIFQLDAFWERSQLWLTSSFNRHGAYFRFYIFLMKAYCLLVFLLFRFNSILQAIMFWLGTVYAFYTTLRLFPYRVLSSNLIAVVFVSLLLINSTFAMCNAFGVQNSVMVSSTESIWLLSFNSIGLFLILTVIGASLAGLFDRWPTYMTLKRINESAKWSTMAQWIDIIEEANSIDMDVCLCPPETADILALEEVIRQLRKCWMNASSIGSVFTVILSDHLNRLMITHARVSPNALRNKKYWDKEYIKSGREMFDTRHKKFNLWNEKKRRMQLKLFAVSALLGNRILKKDSNFGRIRPNEPAVKAIENWHSKEEYEKLMSNISLLTARTEVALHCRAEEELNENDYTKALQSDEDKKKENDLFLKHIDDLMEIYKQWDDIIDKYENKDLPGGGDVNGDSTEDWYTYRHVIAESMDKFRERISENSPEVESDDTDEAPEVNNMMKTQPLMMQQVAESLSHSFGDRNV